MEEKRPHPGTAAVLSFIFNGLGQIYNGQIKKGLLTIFFSALSLLIFIIGAILVAFWILGSFTSVVQAVWGFLLLGLGLILICILGIWSIIDAYNVARG